MRPLPPCLQVESGPGVGVGGQGARKDLAGGRTNGPHGPLGPQWPTPHPAPEATGWTQG